MKNAKIIAVFAAALTIAFSATVYGDGFERSKSYSDGIFSDVPSDAWYTGEVRNTYELGLMNGKGEGFFSPSGNVTVAEAITMASRALSVYSGEEIAPSEGVWYQMYVDYALTKGFVTEGQFDSFDRPAKRYEVAQLFKNAMPDGYFIAQNSVKEIPDISNTKPYAADLLVLYNAGVVMGSDEYGNFNSENNITRAEAAAIINRVALPENRLKKSLDVYSQDNAYLLVYNDSFDSWGDKEGINSGWTLDNRGGAPRVSIFEDYGSLADVSEEYGTAMIREFNNTTTGLVVLESRFSVSENSDGIYMDFRNSEGNLVYRLEANAGAWNLLNPDGTYAPVYEFSSGETVFSFRIAVDLDNNRSTTVINNTDCGTYPLATSGKATNLQNYRYGTTEESTGVIRGTAMTVYVNYAVYDTFAYDNQTVPFGWSGSNIKASGSLNIYANGGYAAKSFLPVSGTVVAETKFLFDKGQKTEYRFKNGGNNVAVFSSDENNFYVNDVKVYENYSKTVRYTFRLEMNTDSQTVVVKINGRKVSEVPFANSASFIDNLAIFNMSASGTLNVPYIRVFEKKIAEDYVPIPVKPAGEEKYNVGINVCSLWRNGMHSGWACITPYSDIEPVLGYYDEGNPETADWEIKYMVEHGIDFQAFCWFAGENSVPINNTPNDYQLRDGFMNAEYSDMMKYCLIWEASSGAVPTNMQQWKDYFVPYFIEHYFKDDRYMTVDNRLLLYVFTPDKVYGSKGFGSTALCKEAFDYLEAEVQKLGFEGMIYVGSNAGSSKTLADAGFDATSAYNWGSEGYKLEVNKTRNLANSKDTSVFTIPTLSVGFNSVPWHGVRYPLMTAEDLKAAALWARDEFSPATATEDWQKNLYMLSTWNEYGEGTYMMPCDGLNGFGYLDSIREAFTDEKADSALNTVPTAAQKKRINRMYPQDKKLLRKNGDWKEPEKVLDMSTYKTVLEVLPGTHAGSINASSIDGFAKNADGTISGTTASADNYLAFGNGNSLDLTSAKVVKITAKIPAGQSMRFYFTTVADSTWNESKAKSAEVSSGEEFAEYIFDFTENSKWDGTLKWYRIDPAAASACDFVIKSIEFMGSTVKTVPEEKTTLTVNGNAAEMKLPPAKSAGGDYLIAYDPSIGLDFLFNVIHTWNYKEKTLTIESCGHKLVYMVGKDSYILDGKSKKLGFELEEFDALPMIPLEKFCEDLGYEFEMTEDGPSVTTTEKQVKEDFYGAKDSRIAYSWEFNVNGDNEGWSTSHMSQLTADGFMSCKSNSSYADPSFNINVTPFEAERYNKIKFRVRYSYTPTLVDVKDEDGNPTGEKEERFESLTMYFATSSSASLSEGKTIKLRLDSSSSHGEWEEYECDITNEEWKDKITKLRFDPFNAVGEIDIDYIRIVEDPEYEAKKNMPKPFVIVNPDAEDSKVGFISHNAKVEIVMDPIEGSDNCYRFVPKDNSKQWIYAIQDVSFTPGKTYKIEYDICIAAHGNSTEIPKGLSTYTQCNFQYKDSSGNNHNVPGTSTEISFDKGWVHVSAEYTVPKGLTDRSADRFTVYANPVDEKGVGFCLDNVNIVEME